MSANTAAKNNKKSFHIEKLRSLAFKTLMHSLRNEFNQIVPEHAQQELTAPHIDLLDFMAKAFFFIPKVCPTKKNGLENGAQPETTGKITIRKATLSEIFGFNSFNKQFRERVFGDYLFAMPLLLILENYRHYRTKFKEEFVGIFDEFKALCSATVADFDPTEEIYKMKRQAARVMQCEMESVNLMAFKLQKFAAEFGFTQEVTEDLIYRAEEGDLFNVFLTVVKKLESPLGVYGLKQSFELYISLLKIKHFETEADGLTAAEAEVAEYKLPALEKYQQSVADDSNASTGVPSESATPRASASYVSEFENPIDQLIHEITVEEEEAFASIQPHSEFFCGEPQLKMFNEVAAECSDVVFSEKKPVVGLIPNEFSMNFFAQEFDHSAQNEAFLFPEIY